MTKNPFEDPEAEFYGKKVKDYKFSERKEAPLGNKAPDLEGYIYVPKIKLYVAKERSLYGLDWYDTHRKLHKNDMQMLTPRQFLDFILYLKKNPNMPDAKKILDEILGEREEWRGEWLDAKFIGEVEVGQYTIAGLMPPKRGKGPMSPITTLIKEEEPIGLGPDDNSSKKSELLYIHYNHRIKNGKLVAMDIESLEKCLMGDGSIDLKSCNRQGLPTKSGDDMLYNNPKEGCVAGFLADSRRGGCLSCCKVDYWSSLQQGVRAALKKKAKTKRQDMG